MNIGKWFIENSEQVGAFLDVSDSSDPEQMWPGNTVHISRVADDVH